MLKDFIEKGQVKKSSKDISLAKSLITMAENDLKFLNRLKINENSARKIMSNYYDVLRSNFCFRWIQNLFTRSFYLFSERKGGGTPCG